MKFRCYKNLVDATLHIDEPKLYRCCNLIIVYNIIRYSYEIMIIDQKHNSYHVMKPVPN